MKKNKKATSIVEAVVVMLIVITGVVGMYNIYNTSTKLSNTTKNRIEAIEIAREGLEAMKNIRNTNWILFPSDKDNCWNVLNYNSSCVGNNTTTNDIASGSYIIYQNTDNRWYLASKATGVYSNSIYRNNFKIQKDSKGLYTQSGGVDFKPIFTRELQISYPLGDSNTSKMGVKSIVQWSDNSSENIHKVELDLELSNWEK